MCPVFATQWLPLQPKGLFPGQRATLRYKVASGRQAAPEYGSYAYIFFRPGTNAKDHLTWIPAELFATSFKILSSLQHPKRSQDRDNIPFPP